MIDLEHFLRRYEMSIRRRSLVNQREAVKNGRVVIRGDEEVFKHGRVA